MSSSAFTSNFAMYDSTVVENLFLLEFMPYAPGDYVKVYLYGLMQCRNGGDAAAIESLAATLNISVEQALNAMRYWEQKGLVVRLKDNPPTFEYQNVRSAMEAVAPEDNAAYTYANFNDQLQSIFGLLHPQQFRLAMEWVEDLHLPQEVVLFMAEKTNALLTLKNGGKPRSIGYVFKALSERAVEWAKLGIHTLEAAKAEISRELPPYQTARKVLDSFGLRRNPTAAEVALAAKWLGEWQYTEAQVLAALVETTKSASPSFAYLDGILSGMMGRAQNGGSREAVKSVLEALGAPSRTPTEALTAAYDQLLAQGFDQNTILRAAALCNTRGQRTFEKLRDVLAKWLSLGLTTPEAVDRYLERRASLRKLTLSIFSKAGISRDPTDADLDQTGEWLAKAEPALIEYAAECARGLSIPARSITKRLNEWQAAGVRDVASAAAFKRPRAAKADAPDKAPAQNPALDYAQRKYDEHDFDHLFTNLDHPQEEQP